MRWFLILLLLGATAQAQDQTQPPTPEQLAAIVRAVQMQRDRALNDHALAEARVEMLNAELAKLKAELDKTTGKK